MQGTKPSRGSPKESPKKVSPRPERQLKLSPVELSSSSSSIQSVVRTPKDKSPKVIERRSPRSPLSEKKRPSKLSELESQIAQLQDDLKKVKDRLIVSETSKREAQEDAEQVRKELEDVSLKLEESQKQLTEFQSISQEKDQELESQIESGSLKSAYDEIQNLKQQLETVAKSQEVQEKQRELTNDELQTLKINLEETLPFVEDMKTELKSCRESEEQAQELVRETLNQLEAAKGTVNELRSDVVRSSEAYNSIAYELEKSRARVNILEGIVSKLNADLVKSKDAISVKTVSDQNFGEEVNQLKSALEAADMRNKEEKSHNNEQMRNANELLEQMKAKSIEREAELETELKKANTNIEELKANLMDKETELQGITEENENLNMRIERSLSCQKDQELESELKKLGGNVEDMKSHLIEKESKLQTVLEENEMLKQQIKNQHVADEIETCKAAEKDAMTKLSCMIEEVDNSKRKTVRVTEQLEAAQTANVEMEAELRRLKVQSDQWRKAAEAAAAMLSPGGNGKCVERTGSIPSYSPFGGKLSSPYLDDYDEDESFKKKNGNVLKKIGVLWKKPQK